MLSDWTDSLKFDGLSAEAERLFIRLIMKADDFGRFYAEPRLLKSLCFPLLENLRPNDLIRWLDELSTRQLILRYEAEGRQLLAIVKFGQRLKDSRAKFPAPEGKPADWLASNDDFREVPGSSRKCEDTSGLNRIEENTNTNTNTRENGKSQELPEQNEKGLPTTPVAKRVASLFNRRLTTAWAEAEVRAFKKAKITMEDMDLIEPYYAAQRSLGDEGHHRRDLKTFLNNFPGEMDRARAYSEIRKPNISTKAKEDIDSEAYRKWCSEKYPNLIEIHQDPRTADAVYLREFRSDTGGRIAS